MPCFQPIPALIDTDENGIQTVRLHPPLGTANVHLDCNKCDGCKAKRRQQWAERGKHEASLYDFNLFLNLTYDDEHLPTEGHLTRQHFTKFVKRLRTYDRRQPDAFQRDHTRPIRLIYCGEYGERNGRPHYHGLFFNLGLTDGQPVGTSNGHTLYRSPILTQLWPYGHHWAGYATAGAAAGYISKYALKTDPNTHRTRDGWQYDLATGEARPAPFIGMSTRPGIGAAWLAKYQNDMRHGYLISNGTQTSIPRFYKRKLRELNPLLAEQLDYEAGQHTTPYDPARLEAAEAIHKSKRELFGTTQRKL